MENWNKPRGRGRRKSTTDRKTLEEGHPKPKAQHKGERTFILILTKKKRKQRPRDYIDIESLEKFAIYWLFKRFKTVNTESTQHVATRAPDLFATLILSSATSRTTHPRSLPASQLQSAGAVVLVLWEGAVLERRSIEVNSGSNTWQNAI